MGFAYRICCNSELLSQPTQMKTAIFHLVMKAVEMIVHLQTVEQNTTQKRVTKSIHPGLFYFSLGLI
jgi:hypothetical protein